MLTLENISCSRGGRSLFRNLGFTLTDRCIMLVRGDNGCGKTTLLETIACLRKPDTGKILYANKDVRGENYKEYCDIIQYVGHQTAVKPQLTVIENIEFWASLKGNLTAVEAAISFFGLTDVKDLLCYRLSAGYQKRVALSMLMVTNSQVWLLDEPFVNLDESGREMLSALINARCANNGSVILAAHGEVPWQNYSEVNLQDFR